jgi:hypothetical protein
MDEDKLKQFADDVEQLLSRMGRLCRLFQSLALLTWFQFASCVLGNQTVGAVVAGNSLV